jgi:hypothetical protein
MPVFRTAPPSLFREERAEAFEAFAEKAMDFLRKDYPSFECLGDVIKADGVAWQVLKQQSLYGENNPLRKCEGSLDFIAACLDEGISIKKIWNQVSRNNYQGILGELGFRGLHGIHFRMDVASEADRIAYTCKLANELFEDAARSSNLPALNILSAVTYEVKPSIIGFVVNPPSGEGGCRQVSVDEATSLSNLSYRGETQAHDDDSFRHAVKRYLQPDRLKDGLGQAVEKALIPLVYNFGYKLKAEGVDNETVMREVSRRIDILVADMGLNEAFQNALSRQILINLFSAFPDGLKMLQAKPEELQGVMLAPVLIDDPLAALFPSTLQGPLKLFSHSTVNPREHQAGKIIDYLTDAGYPLELDTAIQGCLATEHFLVHLAYRQSGRSPALEKKLEENIPLNQVHRSVLTYLSEPGHLCDYSDAAVLRVIAEALDLEENAVSKFKKPVPNRASRTPEGYSSMAPILKDRPHLFESVLEMIEDRNLLTQGIIEWCGFTHRELKALGKRAPNELKKVILESSLGL